MNEIIPKLETHFGGKLDKVILPHMSSMEENFNQQNLHVTNALHIMEDKLNTFTTTSVLEDLSSVVKWIQGQGQVS